jgi:hypothetical protein
MKKHSVTYLISLLIHLDSIEVAIDKILSFEIPHSQITRQLNYF